MFMAASAQQLFIRLRAEKVANIISYLFCSSVGIIRPKEVSSGKKILKLFIEN